MAQPVHVTPIGTRRAQVTVEHRVESSGGGFPVDTWATLAVLWMQKVDVIGTEAFRADQMSARYDVRFIGPYARTLDPEVVDVPATQRLSYRGRVYDIVAAQLVGNFEGVEYRAITHTGT